MSVNVPHGFDVYEIIFYFLPVRLMVIFKMRIPVYLCIEEIAVLCGIAKQITVLTGLPFIYFYTLLPVNGNGFRFQILPHYRRIDIMSISFLSCLLPFVFALFLHRAEYHLIISDHINQICMGIYIFLRQPTIDKKPVMLRVGYKKPVLPLCHKTVTHSIPAICILVGIKTYPRL